MEDSPYLHVRTQRNPHPNADWQVLMAVLERVLSDQWTEAMANAWSGLFQVGLYLVTAKHAESLLVVFLEVLAVRF